MDGIILLTGLIDQLKINKDKDMRSITNAKGLNAIINWVDAFSTKMVYVMAVAMFFFIIFQILR